jgi:hypothetical protein
MNNLDLTIFMNRKSFSSDEIKRYPYENRKTYTANWTDDPEADPFEFYATDDKTAVEYLDRIFKTMPNLLWEKIINYRQVDI